MDSGNWYKQTTSELTLHLSIQPRSHRDEVVGLHDDRLKLRITAPPVDGKANNHLLAYLAKAFGVTKANVQLINGEHSRKKSVLILSPQKQPEWFTRLIQNSCS